MVQHIVVFKYRPGTTRDQIQQVTDAFRELKSAIPGIMSFQHGANTSPEGKDQGFGHVYVLTFASEQARDAYLPHPDHRRFGDMLAQLGVVEEVFVVDFQPEE